MVSQDTGELGVLPTFQEQYLTKEDIFSEARRPRHYP
jgi:hypothetical protein